MMDRFFVLCWNVWMTFWVRVSSEGGFYWHPRAKAHVLWCDYWPGRSDRRKSFWRRLIR